jgi:Spy/CpxP family protein refolding chaperone
MNTRLTNTILIVMLVLNLAFVGTWWMSKMKQHNRMHHAGDFHSMEMHDKGGMFLARQLNFDSNQSARAEKILHEHADKMHRYEMEISRLQRDIFKCMSQDSPDSIHAYMYADSVGMLRIATQKEFFRNSIAIRQLCTPEQKKKYDDLMQNMTRRMNHFWENHSGAGHHDSL